MFHTSPRRRWIAGVATAALTATPLAVLGSMAPAHAATVDIQILGTNDFHGRLADRPTGSNNPEPIEMASVMSGAVKQLRTQNPNTVFSAAGDLIGASTFESFIQHDKPTLDALNEAGLEVSAAGNHEFDAGYLDLLNRVMAPYDPTTNPEGGAEWEYLSANVRKISDDSHALGPNSDRWIKDFGNGVQVGFIGAVTEDLLSLVSPAAPGNDQIKVSSVVAEANASADALKAEGADVVVLLVHEGAADTTLATATGDNTFGRIVNGVNANIDAIVSGHTHLAYNHSVPVQAWIDQGRAVTQRPVVSAGQYGTKLNQLLFSVDTDPDGNPATDDAAVTAKSQNVLDLFGADSDGSSGPLATPPNYPVDAATKAIVDDAFAKADVLGAVKVGEVSAAFNRARLSTGGENRGAESTLGNLVAEVQREATSSVEAGSAQIAFMNPGGLRADMKGNNASGYPADLTYKQAAVVQPFANTLVNMDMTGDQIKTLLEQQWQRDSLGNVPSRPHLRLGTSAGFTFTFDATRPEGDRITGMWLDGVAIDPAASYSVTANSFLASGGDNFRVFREATNKRDTGKVDLQAMVDHAAAHSPLARDNTQHAVGVSAAAGVPSAYRPGELFQAELSSWSFSTADDVRDSEVDVLLDGVKIGTSPVDNTLGTSVFDDFGKISVRALVPADTETGRHTITVSGPTTGTAVDIPVRVESGPARAASTVTATATPASIETGSGTSTVAVEVTAPSHVPTGFVTVSDGGVVVGGAQLMDGTASVVVGPFEAPGERTLTVDYRGDQATLPGSDVVTLTVTPAPVVEKATPVITATPTPSTVTVMKDEVSVAVGVTTDAGPATGAVLAFVGDTVVGAGELTDGAATLSLRPFEMVGTASVEVRYFGDEATKPGSTTAEVTVVKATPALAVKAPKRVVKGKRATFKVTVSAFGYTPTGKVTLKVAGKKMTTSLTDGKATFRVRLTKVGRTKAVVTYAGDARTTAKRKVVRLRVVRR